MKKSLILISFLYAVITLLYFYPLINTLDKALIGPPEDNMQHYWTLWYFGESFLNRDIDFLYTNHIFYPEGSSMFYHALSPYNLLLSRLFHVFMNLVSAYNLLIIMTFIISGLGAFLLIRYLTKNTIASIIGGFIFAFNPSHFAHSLHHIEIASIQFIPFFLLYFIKSINSSTAKDLLLAALFFLLLNLSTLYYFVLTLILMLLIYTYIALKKKKIILKNLLFKISVISGVTILILSPILVNMVILGLNGKAAIGAGGHYNTMLTDLFALFTPGPCHLLSFNNIISSINLTLSGNPWEKTAYLGIINIIIVIFTISKTYKESAKYFLGLFSFLILAMGSHLHIMGLETQLALPYQIIKDIPVLLSMRTPSRAIVYVYLFWSIIVGFSIKYILNSNLSKKRLILSIIAFLIFLDFLSFNNSKTYVFQPDVYEKIGERGDFGILDLPTGYYIFSSYYMVYQTHHNIPIAGGYLARKLNISLVDYLSPDDLNKQKEELTEKRVKYIVLHKNFFDPAYLNKAVEPYISTYNRIYEDHNNILLKVY